MPGYPVARIVPTSPTAVLLTFRARSGPESRDRTVLRSGPNKSGDRATVTGQMRSDRSDGACRMANRNYGGNGGRSVIMAAMAAVQLN